MPSFRELMFINDPPFALGEKVQPAKPEPAPCPYAAFERGDCGGPAPSAHHRETRANAGDAGGPAAKSAEFGATVKADPDGWIPHDGGPCPVDGNAFVDVRHINGTEARYLPASRLGWERPPSGFGTFIVAYKLATPPEEVKVEIPWNASREEAALFTQQQRQKSGLPVEWDKVPVGGKVWVRKFGGYNWVSRNFTKWVTDSNYPWRTLARHQEEIWQQCKLHIEGVAP